MLPTYDQKKPTKTTLPTFNTRNPDASRTINLTPCFVYFNLTICSLTTLYRAYEHSDYPVVAFVVFVYVSYFVLEKCLAVYTMLPRGEQSVKKELLRFTLWGLSSAILFGFAYQFGTFMPLSAVVLMYCIAVSSSLLLFYAYYIVDDQNHTGCSFCATMPPHSSCPNQEKTNNSDNV
ncbi:hypothetical protein ACE6H2_012303 [Prunus campanulata]